VRKVLAGFREISQTEGAKSTEKKRGMIQKMLVAAKDVEAGFLVRSLQGKLRIGLAQATVLTALAHAVLLQVPAPSVPEPIILPHNSFCAVAHTSASLCGLQLCRCARNFSLRPWTPAHLRWAVPTAVGQINATHGGRAPRLI
jgi:ATP-dependent DNA ligase